MSGIAITKTKWEYIQQIKSAFGNSEFTVRDITRLRNVSRTSARDMLEKLSSQGFLERIKDGNRTYYRLAYTPKGLFTRMDDESFLMLLQEKFGNEFFTLEMLIEELPYTKYHARRKIRRLIAKGLVEEACFYLTQTQREVLQIIANSYDNKFFTVAEVSRLRGTQKSATLWVLDELVSKGCLDKKTTYRTYRVYYRIKEKEFVSYRDEMIKLIKDNFGNERFTIKDVQKLVHKPSGSVYLKLEKLVNVGYLEKEKIGRVSYKNRYRLNDYGRIALKLKNGERCYRVISHFED